MPLVTISLRTGTSTEYRRAIADGVHRAMMDTLGIPADDRFQLVAEYAPENFIHDRVFFGLERSEKSIFVQITINQREVTQKRSLYEHIAKNLSESPGIPQEDVFVNIVEVAQENWWAFARPPAAAAR